MPPSLYFKIIRMLKRNSSTAYLNYFDQDELLDELPSALRNEVLAVTHKKILETFGFFRGKPPQFVIDMIPLFKHISMSVDELLFRKADYVEEIYFLMKGRVGLIDSEGFLFRNFVQGAYFGEVEMFNQKVYKYILKRFMILLYISVFGTIQH